MSVEDGDEDFPTFGGDGVAVAAADLLDDAMGAQQSELAAGSGGQASPLLRAVSARMELGEEITVAQAVDGELTAGDSREQGVVVG